MIHGRQTQHNPTLWRPTNMQMVSEPLPTPSSPSAVRETHDDVMTSASYSAFNSGPYGTCCDSHAAFDTPWTLCPNSSDGRLLPAQDVRDPNNHLPHEPSAYQPLSHATYSPYTSAPNDHVADSFIPHHLSSHRSLGPSLPH
jgi:hypothetical protein